MTARTPIIALRAPWLDAIRSGAKELEFRRSWARLQPPYRVVVYAASPLSAICGTFEVRAHHVTTAATLSELGARFRFPGPPERISAYLRGRSGVALEIGRYQDLEQPIPLKALRALGFTPPQNYAYLDTYPAVAELLGSSSENQVFEKALAPDAPARENESHQLGHQRI